MITEINHITLSVVLLLVCVNLGVVQVPDSTSSATQLRIVNSVTLFKDNAGRPEWSPNGNEYVTYHSKEPDGYYDIYIMKADGSEETCLTCGHPRLPNKHIGQPSWHPSGRWIVFQAEKAKHVLPRISALAVPGIGFHNDIYIMSRDGKRVYKLTNLKTKKHLLDPTSVSGILQPHFSNDGSLLSWSERIAKGGKWGEWVIRLADFKVNNGVPEISNIQTFRPGVNRLYYESNDFTPDGKKLIICGNLEKDQNAFGIDIYTMTIDGREVTRLTHTLDEFDECPHPSPDGKKIAYLSTKGFENNEGSAMWWEWARGEFWVMDADGGNKQRLTYFNEPGYPEYTGRRVIPAYVSWNEDGNKLLIGVAVEEENGRLKDQLYLIELE